MKPILDPRGQWAHPGKVTKIPSNNITMKGVPYPVLGISNTGDKKLMMPNKNYKFKGTSVTEYPWLKKYQVGGGIPSITIPSGTVFPNSTNYTAGNTGATVADPYAFSYKAGATKLTEKQWKKLDASQQQEIWRKALMSQGFTQIGENSFSSNGKPDSFQIGGAIGTAVGTALNFIPGIGPIASQIATPLLTALGQGIENKIEGPEDKKKITAEKMFTQNPYGFQAGGSTQTVTNPTYTDIYNYLVSKGVSQAHAVGMLANIKAESNFNPAAIGDAGTSGGLFQHHNTRFDAMKKHAGENWKTNWQGQVDYALTESDTKKYLKQSFTTPEEASKWFTVNWERPSNAQTKAEERIKYISSFALNSGDSATPLMDLTPQMGTIAADNTATTLQTIPMNLNAPSPVLSFEKQGVAKKAYGGPLPGKLIPLKQEGKFEPLGDGLFIAKGPSHKNGGIDADLAINGTMDGSPEINLEGGEIVDDSIGYIFRKKGISDKYISILKNLKDRTDQVSKTTRTHLRNMMVTENEEMLSKEKGKTGMAQMGGEYGEVSGIPLNDSPWYKGSVRTDSAGAVTPIGTYGMQPFPNVAATPGLAPLSNTTNTNQRVYDPAGATTNGSGRFKNTPGDWAQLAGIAIPTIYNAYKAFQPAEEVKPVNNPYENKVKGLMSNRFYNEQATQNAITLAMNTGINQINSSTNSSAIRRSNISNLIGNTEQQRASANLQGQQMNNAYRAEEAATLNNLGQQRVGATNLAQQINYANRGAKDAYGVAAVEGLGQGLTAFGQMRNTNAFNNTALTVMNSAFPNYYWDVNTLNQVSSGVKPSWMSDADFSRAQALLYRK